MGQEAVVAAMPRRSNKVILPIEHGTDLTFAPSATVRTNKVPRVGALLDLIVRLAGTLTISGGTTDGTLIQDGIMRLINAIRIYVGGTLVRSYTGRGLHLIKNKLEMGVAPELTQPGVTVAAHPFVMTMVLPLAIPDLPPGIGERFALPTGRNGYPEIMLEIETGAVTDIISGGDRSYAWAGTWTVSGRYDKAEPQPRGWYWSCRELETEDTIPATASAPTGREVELPTDYQSVRRIGLLATDNNVRSDSLLTNPVDLAPRPGEKHADAPFLLHKQATRERFRIAPDTGVAVMDFDRDGSGRGLPALRGNTRPLLRYVHIAGTGVSHVKRIVQEITFAE